MPARYKPYPKYKSSGIEWICEVPKSWKFIKFYYICYMKGRIGWQGLKQSEFVDEGPFLITGMNFKDGAIRWNEVYHITEQRYQEAPEIHLRLGDVLMTKDGTIGKLLYVDELPGKASLNSHLLLLRPLNNEFCTRFLYYNLQADIFKGHIELTKTGTTFYGITQESVGQYKLLLPPLSEQRAIAAFLDHETGKLDDVIERQRELIELLEERRQAVISHAVTKGLNPDAPMKPSDIEWLGNIPEHWEVWKLAHAYDEIGSGTTPPSGEEKWYGGEICWVTTGELRESYVRDSQKKLHMKTLQAFPTLRLYPKGSIAMAMYGATIGRLGILDIEATTNQACCVLPKSKHLDNKYVFYWLRAFRSEIIQLSSGGGQPNINQEKVASLKVSAPPVVEQQQIVDHLDKQITKIDKLISKAQEAIELVQERRSAVISSAVTGKIDVREAAAQLAAEQEPSHANVFFRRAVLAAEVAECMHQQNTFGRVKFQKALALCEMHLGMDIDGNYKRDAAGPFDNRMMRSIAKQLKDQQWFQEVERENGYGRRYEPMDKRGGHRKYFERYWGDKQSQFNDLIHLLSRMDSRQAEIVATLYSAWRDFLAEGKQPTDDELVTEVRTNWHESKKQIEPETWHKAIDWMRKEGLVPVAEWEGA